MDMNSRPAQPFPDLTRAPFVVPEGASAAAVAGDIVACLVAVQGLERRSCQVFEAVRGVIGLAPDAPFARAGVRIAAQLEDALSGQSANSYHNSQHICEVMLCSLFLAKQAGLPPGDQARLMVSALIHDFHHDGTTNAAQHFRLEQLAVDSTRVYLEAASVPPVEIPRIAAMVLATEVSMGVPYAGACFRHFYQNGAKPQPVPEGGDLALLATDPDLAFQAVLLSEADLLPSVGLTYDYSLLCQERLSRENRCIAPGLAQKLHFLDHVVQGFLVGRFFEPNLAALRGAIVAALAREENR